MRSASVRNKAGRRARGFFDDHQRFLETSTTASSPARLNLRHRTMIEQNRDVLAHARVLDLASHDGRFSLAALEAGAAYVTGIEARPELVARAEESLATYKADPGSYRFVTGDLFSVLARERLDVDVVLCFGFVYHTLRYPELFSRLRRLEPHHLLLDTRVEPGKGRFIKVLVNEATAQSQAATDDFTEGTQTLVGVPSPEALRFMLQVYGFDIEHAVEWNKAAKDAPRVTKDYRSGSRITWRCRWSPP